MLISFLTIFSILFLFPEIKIFSYSLSSFFIFFYFLFLFLYKDFRELFTENKKYFIIWLIFLLLNIFSIIFSDYKILAIKGAGKIISLSLLFWILLWFFKKNCSDTFFNFFMFLLIFSSLLNLFLFFNPKIIYDYLSKLYFHQVTYPRLGYPFLYPNTFSFFLIIMLIIILFNAKYTNPILYLFVSLGIILSGSKAGLVFYTAFSIIRFFLKEKIENKKFMILIMIISILVFINLWLSVKDNKILSKLVYQIRKEEGQSIAVKEYYTLQKYKETSIKNRIDIWKDSIYYFYKKPIFGYGPLVHRYELTKNLSHNIFLDFLMSYGILGFVFLIYFIILILKKIFIVKKQIYLFLFIYFLLNSFIETMFFNGIIDIIFYGFLIKLINEKDLNKLSILGSKREWNI